MGQKPTFGGGVRDCNDVAKRGQSHANLETHGGSEHLRCEFRRNRKVRVPIGKVFII
jgi:hypothetical protein